MSTQTQKALCLFGSRSKKALHEKVFFQEELGLISTLFGKRLYFGSETQVVGENMTERRFMYEHFASGGSARAAI